MSKAREFEVGQRVWFFDQNYRVYPKDGRGHSTGSPIFQEYFRPMTVTGIDGRSYLIQHGHPAENGCVAKVGFEKAEKAYLSDQAREDKIWSEYHRIRIADRIRRSDLATLRKVAEVIGYEPGGGQS